MPRFRVEYVVVAIPVLIAALHIPLVETSSQTRWKGGGFGMYSDPHPNSYRVVWLAGESEDGESRAFALEPFDDRVRRSRIQTRSKRKALRELHEIAEHGKNFPAFIDRNALAKLLRSLGRQSSDDEELDRALELLPRRDVRLRVMEIEINPEYSALETKQVYEAPVP